MSKRRQPFMRCQGWALAAALAAASLCAPTIANALTLPANGTGPVALLTELHVKPAAFDAFMKVMRANVAHSRTEPGNIGFDVFQPKSGEPTLYVLEQWRDPSFTRAHLQQPTLLQMHSAAKNDLTGAISPMLLHGLSAGTGTRKEAPVADEGATENVLVYLSLKPGERQTMLEGFSRTVPTFRAEPGNISFDVFQDAADPDTMVQLERWRNADTHNANLKRPVIGEIRGVFKQTLAKPLMSHRALLKDISEGGGNA